jgi:hypothetical protein
MEKLTLRGYYHSLPTPVPPKTDFIKRVAGQCEVGLETVRNWIRGDARPSNEKHYDILSELTGISKDQLFADESN